MGFIAPIIAVAAQVFSSFAGAGGGGGGAPPIIPAPLPPTEDTEAVRRRAEEERRRRAKAKGLSSTILTGGVKDDDLALSQPTLLGSGTDV